jgi:hypothetical protein
VTASEYLRVSAFLTASTTSINAQIVIKLLLLLSLLRYDEILRVKLISPHFEVFFGHVLGHRMQQDTQLIHGQIDP